MFRRIHLTTMVLTCITLSLLCSTCSYDNTYSSSNDTAKSININAQAEPFVKGAHISSLSGGFGVSASVYPSTDT